MTPKHCLDSLSVPSIHRGTLILAASLLAGAIAPGQQTTERVSVDSLGNQGNNESRVSSISGDGRYASFASKASNLVLGDTNGIDDVFVRDSQTGATQRVSVASSGTQGNARSVSPSSSSDGRYVAFYSEASNLVPSDTNGWGDVFLHDRQTGVTELVSVDSSGNQGNSTSEGPSVSVDGRYVAFFSFASNLVAGDTNGLKDVFIHDRQTGATERVSVSSAGIQVEGPSENPSVSQDGRYVAFVSGASKLVPFDSNGVDDIFVRDRQTGVTERVSVDSSGNQGNGKSREDTAYISGDGRYVAFWSEATNLVPADTNGAMDVFVHDRQTDVTERVSIDSSGNQTSLGGSWFATISGDGRYVAFDSSDPSLAPGENMFDADQDIFVHDRQTGVTERASVRSNGNEGNDDSHLAQISENGHHVVFSSFATNLVPGDTNGFEDVFVRDRSCTDAFVNYCTAGMSASGCTVSMSSTGIPSASATSGFVVTAAFVEGQKDGLFFYGQNGRQANPWGNGTSFQCVVPPVKRGGLRVGNGTAGACDSVITQDLNALWCPTCPKPGHAPIPGKKLQIQFWYRDPLSTSNQSTSLSDAIEVTPCP